MKRLPTLAALASAFVLAAVSVHAESPLTLTAPPAKGAPAAAVSTVGLTPLPVMDGKAPSARSAASGSLEAHIRNIANGGDPIVRHMQAQKNLPKGVRRAESNEDLPTFRACLVMDLDGGRPFGVYDITADGLTQVKEMAETQSDWGGTYGEGMLYITSCKRNIYTGQDFTNYEIDPGTWEITNYKYLVEMNCYNYAMATHPETGMSYGCFTSNGNGCDANRLATFDINKLDINEEIGIVDADHMWSACAFDKNGTLYVLDASGNFGIADLNSMEVNVLKETGIKAYLSMASAIVDDSANRCYITAFDMMTFTQSVYSVDLSTYDVTYHYSLPPFIAAKVAWIPGRDLNESVPAGASNLEATFSDGALNGTFCFTMPTTLTDGTDVSGNLDYKVYCDFKEIAAGNAAAGSKVSLDVTVPVGGLYGYSVVCYNTNGRGKRSPYCTLWVGPDIPSAPADVVMEYDREAEKVLASWSPVTTSVADGYFVPENVTYSIAIYCNNQLVEEVASGIAATAYEFPFAWPDSNGSYHITVIATADGLSSKAGKSNYLTLGTPGAPWTFTTYKQLDFNQFTVVDANNDGSKFIRSGWYGCATVEANYEPDFGRDMDDWIFSPSIRLEGGYAYDIFFRVSSGNIFATEHAEAFIGTDPTVESMTIRAMEPTVFMANGDHGYPYETIKGTVIVPEDGVYYIGFHAMSPVINSNSVLLHGLEIDRKVYIDAPAEATDIEVIPDYDGEQKATIRFKAPTTTVSGEPLESIDYIAISDLDEEETLTWLWDVEPGADVECEVEMVADNGYDTHIGIVTYGDWGNGPKAMKRCVGGVNDPAHPTDLKIEALNPNNPNQLTLSWNSVAKDINGYDINPELIRYVLAAVYDDGSWDAIDYEAPLSTEQWVLNFDVPEGVQGSFRFGILPLVDGRSPRSFTFSDHHMLGTPAAAPVVDSASGKENAFPWTYTDFGQWGLAALTEYPYTRSMDGDGGFFVWTPSFIDRDGYFESGYITLDDTSDNYFSFYYYAMPGDLAMTFHPYVRLNGERIQIADEIDVADENVPQGWRRVAFSLADYAGKTIQVGIWGHTLTMPKYNLAIDYIKVGPQVADDIALRSLKTEPVWTVEAEQTIDFIVYNEGLEEALYNVEVTYGDLTIATVENETLAANDKKSYSLKYTPDQFTPRKGILTVKAVSADDDFVNNNKLSTSVTITPSAYAPVTDLAATALDGAVSLSWTEPDYSPKPVTVTETVESLTEWEDDITPWTAVDVDQWDTYGLSGISYPIRYKPAAFVVYGFGEVIAENYPQFGGLNSQKFFGSMSAAPDETNHDYPTDDWLISPELPGAAFTLSLYAETFSTNHSNMVGFEVYASANSKELDDFVKIAEVEDIPLNWKEYTFEIPEGTKYFAIRHADSEGLLAIDDITYLTFGTELRLAGYDVYRDGEKIAVAITATEYLDADVEAGSHDYNVVAVYDLGASDLSNTATVDVTSLAALTASVKVYATADAIHVDGAEGSTVYIYTPDGLTLNALTAAANTRIPAAKGIYVVKVGNGVYKVTVN